MNVFGTGSSEGGSSGNAAAGRVFDMKKIRVAVVTEEATSSFRLEFKNKNHKRGFEFGNEDVERASDEDDNGMSRKKLRLSKEQSAYLEETFKEHNTLNPVSTHSFMFSKCHKCIFCV